MSFYIFSIFIFITSFAFSIEIKLDAFDKNDKEEKCNYSFCNEPDLKDAYLKVERMAKLAGSIVYQDKSKSIYFEDNLKIDQWIPEDMRLELQTKYKDFKLHRLNVLLHKSCFKEFSSSIQYQSDFLGYHIATTIHSMSFVFSHMPDAKQNYMHHIPRIAKYFSAKSLDQMPKIVCENMNEKTKTTVHQKVVYSDKCSLSEHSLPNSKYSFKSCSGSQCPSYPHPILFLRSSIDNKKCTENRKLERPEYAFDFFLGLAFFKGMGLETTTTAVVVQDKKNKKQKFVPNMHLKSEQLYSCAYRLYGNSYDQARKVYTHQAYKLVPSFCEEAKPITEINANSYACRLYYYCKYEIFPEPEGSPCFASLLGVDIKESCPAEWKKEYGRKFKKK